jgi:hypothetical protein
MSYLTFPHIGTSSSGLTNVWDVNTLSDLGVHRANPGIEPHVTHDVEIT